MAYERVGVLGKGGSSKVYSVLCINKRVVYALKRVALDRADAETYQSYANEIELLKRLKGHDRIIQLIDHQITYSQNNRPKMLMMVSLDVAWLMIGDGMWGDRLCSAA
jgi:serine/threonine-protein kinase TTK/MPS1